jgi:hypothetical protein
MRATDPSLPPVADATRSHYPYRPHASLKTAFRNLVLQGPNAWPSLMTDAVTLDPPPLPGSPPPPLPGNPPPLPGLVRFVGPEWAYWQLRIKGAAGLRGIEWANLGYEGPRKLCIS